MEGYELRGEVGSTNGIYLSSWGMKSSGDVALGGRREDEERGGGTCVPEVQEGRKH